MNSAFTLVLQIGAVVMTARAVGALFKKIHQPQVVGEMAAGILLGPSLLGWVAPSFSNILFPAVSLDHLSALSQVGLVLFMFQVGLSLSPRELRGQGHAAILAGNVSIIVPFCLGTLLAYFLYPRFSDDRVTFSAFALFVGAAMSITAFPVLARILAESGLMKTRVGSLAIACAAVNDVVGWCLLAYIVVLVRADRASMPLWMTLGGTVAYLTVMGVGIRRLTGGFEKTFRRTGHLSENALALMMVLVIGSSLATDLLGIHLIFGAFLMGVTMPRSEAMVEYILHRFESVTKVLLLPLFFAFSGLRTNLLAIEGHSMWFYALLVIGAAVAGKLGGTMVAAGMAGIPWRDSAALGILMNTRGLMELMVLNIGLDLGVISQSLFSIMVMMALITTFMTTPLLKLVRVSKAVRVEAEAAAPAGVEAMAASG